MHLGMSGSFRVGQESAQARRLLSRALQEHRARPCGLPHVERRDRHLQRSAPLRLDEAGAARQAGAGAACCARSGRSRWAMSSTRRCWRSACTGKKTSLKAALLDQRVVAGLGNIYVCEALFRARSVAQAAGVHHRRPQRQAECARGSAGRCHQGGAARTRSRPAARRCAIIAAPMARSAISSTISASMIARASRARDCRGTIKRIVQTGRSTFYCPACQK